MSSVPGLGIDAAVFALHMVTSLTSREPGDIAALTLALCASHCLRATCTACANSVSAVPDFRLGPRCLSVSLQHIWN